MATLGMSRRNRQDSARRGLDAARRPESGERGDRTIGLRRRNKEQRGTMNLPTEVFGNVAVVHTPEDISDDRAASLEAFVTSLAQSRVVVDLDGTETIDSTALESLLSMQESLRELDGDVKISTANTVNRTMLEITRLDQQLEVFDSVIDAVKSFQ
jgi:anti-anti-sigma factor